MDLERIRRAVREILLAVGEDPEREGLRETPDRVARMYAEVFEGLNQDPRIHLKKLFTQKYDEILLVKDIRLVSFCEHHLLPVVGKAHVAYRPVERVVGLSKLARLVDVYARRLQTQEQLTSQVAGAIEEVLKPHGVAVLIEAEHTCMSIRGVTKPGVSTVTTRFLGTFRDSPEDQMRFVTLVRGAAAAAT